MTIEQANEYFSSLPEGFAPAEKLRAALTADVQKVQFVGVAGTAGKTAAAGLLAAILREAAFHVGFYRAGCEPLSARIAIGGVSVDPVLFCQAAEALNAAKALPREAAELAAAARCFGAAGCKLAVVDATGKVLDTAVIYPTKPHNKVEESKKTLRRLCDAHGVTCVAIGNGTASRESELFVAEFIKEYGKPLSYMVVSEAGASVYSASKLGAEEFPDFDVSLRSAVSIARRLQDPLAELVKIDPKAIGVGQYQHDMPQARLSQALDGVVEDCVNGVGVDLNTASPSLLRRVAGITPAVSQNVVAYREEHGGFTSRKELLKVPKLGPKAFEQCAGFLRVMESQNVLDHTAVHPESYQAAERLLSLCGYTLQDVGSLSQLPQRLAEVGEAKAAEACGVGLPTLRDIAAELQKPGRDPRDQLPPPLLRTDVMDLSDVKPGMKLSGTVRNVVDFGAFVDIGVHQDGLVHVSQITDRYIRHPSEVLSVGDIVEVTVLSVDPAKKRISLTMREQSPSPAQGSASPKAQRP